MKAIVTFVTRFISVLSVPHTALAHGTHLKVEPYSFVHLFTHNWPLLIILALLVYVLCNKYRKLN